MWCPRGDSANGSSGTGRSTVTVNRSRSGMRITNWPHCTSAPGISFTVYFLPCTQCQAKAAESSNTSPVAKKKLARARGSSVPKGMSAANRGGGYGGEWRRQRLFGAGRLAGRRRSQNLSLSLSFNPSDVRANATARLVQERRALKRGRFPNV